MYIIVTKNSLLPILEAAVKIIPSKPTNAILENLLFTVSENTLHVSSSNVETTLLFKTDVTNRGNNKSILIPGKILLDSVKELPSGAFSIRQNDNNTISLDWTTGKSTLPVFNPEDFPETKEVKSEVSINIPSAKLSEALSQTIYAADDKDTTRPILTGIHFCLKDKKLEIVATDARILSVSTIDTDSEENCKFTVYFAVMNILRNHLAKIDKEDAVTTIIYGNRHVKFITDFCEMTTLLIEGNYPNYNSVFPSTANVKPLTVETSLLLSSIKRISVFRNDEAKAVSFLLENNKLTLSFENAAKGSNAHETILTTYDGPQQSINFNADWLIKVINSLPYGIIDIFISDANRAAVILGGASEENPSSVKTLIMPSMKQ